MSSWSWLANGRLWGAVALAGALALTHCGAYRQGGAAARVDLAELQAAHAEQGRVAALGRAREQEQARAREAALQDQIDKEVNDGQKRIDAAVAAAGRAGAAEQRVRNEFTAFRAAVRGPAPPADAAPAGAPATAAAGVHAELLSELGARTERIAGLAGVYARTADLARANGITCEHTSDAVRTQ